MALQRQGCAPPGPLEVCTRRQRERRRGACAAAALPVLRTRGSLRSRGCSGVVAGRGGAQQLYLQPLQPVCLACDMAPKCGVDSRCEHRLALKSLCTDSQESKGLPSDEDGSTKVFQMLRVITWQRLRFDARFAGAKSRQQRRTWGEHCGRPVLLHPFVGLRQAPPPQLHEVADHHRRRPAWQGVQFCLAYSQSTSHARNQG